MLPHSFFANEGMSIFLKDIEIKQPQIPIKSNGIWGFSALMETASFVAGVRQQRYSVQQD